jgi:hypothetical protein
MTDDPNFELGGDGFKTMVLGRIIWVSLPCQKVIKIDRLFFRLKAWTN